MSFNAIKDYKLYLKKVDASSLPVDGQPLQSAQQEFAPSTKKCCFLLSRFLAHFYYEQKKFEDMFLVKIANKGTTLMAYISEATRNWHVEH